MGSAAPCWRCLEWCRWAGVKRIFHWNGDESRFDVVKVNNAQGAVMYETHADVRLFAGLVRGSPLSDLSDSQSPSAGLVNVIIYYEICVLSLSGYPGLPVPPDRSLPDNCSSSTHTTGEGVTNAGKINYMHACEAA